MAHWLMKSEPATFSWHDLVKKNAPEEWHSVRNYAARNNMKAMTLSDTCFFYHSVQEKQVMGIMKVAALAHPDSTAEIVGGKIVWECVDVLPAKPLPKPVTLVAIKDNRVLAGMVLLNNSRLSVQPVSDEEWAVILKMGGL